MKKIKKFRVELNGKHHSFCFGKVDLKTVVSNLISDGFTKITIIDNGYATDNDRLIYSL